MLWKKSSRNGEKFLLTAMCIMMLISAGCSDGTPEMWGMSEAGMAQTDDRENTSKSFSHKTVIRPLEEGGFQYVSNETYYVGIGWQKGGVPEIKSVSVSDISEMKLTEKGYLIYAHENVAAHSSLRQYWRVKPLSDQCRELTAKYVHGLSYVNYNVLVTNWDSHSYEYDIFTNRIVVQPFDDGRFRYLSNSIEQKELKVPKAPEY